jgi:hypothetical protein
MKRIVILLVVAFATIPAFTQEFDDCILWELKDSMVGWAKAMVVHPNGNLFIQNMEGFIYELDGQTGELIRELPEITGQFGSMKSMSPDGKYIAFGDQRLFLLDLSDNNYMEISPNGQSATFTHDSKQLVYHGYGYDSTIVFYNIETHEVKSIRVEEGLTAIQFSSDGRYFATGTFHSAGQFEQSYTSLKLWDAQTFEMLSELAYIPDFIGGGHNILFSPDSKKVAFRTYPGILIFDTETRKSIKHYNQFGYPYFTFLSNNHLGIQTQNTLILNLSDDSVTMLKEFTPPRGIFMAVNNVKDIMYAGKGSNQFYAWDLNKILASDIEEFPENQLEVNYSSGMLNIELPENITQYSINILNLNGQLIANFKENSIPG